MADFSNIRAALRERLALVSGLNAYTNVPETVNAPAAFIAPDGWDYHQTMGGAGAAMNAARFSVTILAAPMSQSTYSRAQDKLDAYLDDAGTTTSVKAAIEADLTLAGTVSTLIVKSVRDYGVIEWPVQSGLYYIGAVLDMEVWV